MFFSERRQIARSHEKRKEWRVFSQDFKVFLKKGWLRQKVGAGYGRNLSAHGMQFKTSMTLRRGETLQLFIDLHPQFPGLKQIPVEVMVLRTFQVNAGYWEVSCQIDHLDPQNEKVMNQFTWWVELNRGEKSAAEVPA